LNLPSLELIVAFNASVRHNDEWFEEADDLDRIVRILDNLQTANDPIVAAAVATSRITRAQAFTEGNKRTALLVGRWILDRNDCDGGSMIPPDDFELANLLLDAARGADTDEKVVALFKFRRPVGIEPTTEGL
jgi:prophage maintenance system killer protein